MQWINTLTGVILVTACLSQRCQGSAVNDQAPANNSSKGQEIPYGNYSVTNPISLNLYGHEVSTSILQYLDQHSRSPANTVIEDICSNLLGEFGNNSTSSSTHGAQTHPTASSQNATFVASGTRVLSQSLLFNNKDAPNADHGGCFRIPALKHNPTLNVLLATAEARPYCDDYGPNFLVGRISEDRGLTWSDIFQIAAPSAGDTSTYGNVALVNDNNGFLILFNVNNTYIMETRSANGQEWSTPLNITSSTKPSDWGWVAMAPGHAQEHNGLMMMPFNRMLEKSTAVLQFNVFPSGSTDARINFGTNDTSTMVVNDTSANETIVLRFSQSQTFMNFVSQPFAIHANRPGVFRSRDNGQTWDLGGYIPNLIANECQVAHLGGNRSTKWLMTARAQPNENGCRHLATSKDDGQTWSEPFSPNWVNENGDIECILDSVCQSSVVGVDVQTMPNNTTLLLSSSPNSDIYRINQTLWASFDDGVNFIRLVQLSASGGYSDLQHISTRAVDGNVTMIIGMLYEASPSDKGITFARIFIDVETTKADYDHLVR